MGSKGHRSPDSTIRRDTASGRRGKQERARRKDVCHVVAVDREFLLWIVLTHSLHSSSLNAKLKYLFIVQYKNGEHTGAALRMATPPEVRSRKRSGGHTHFAVGMFLQELEGRSRTLVSTAETSLCLHHFRGPSPGQRFSFWCLFLLPLLCHGHWGWSQ